MPESISMIHLPASQSSPPTQHLPSDSLGFPDPPAPLVFPVDPADISETNSQNVTCLWPTCVPLFMFTEHSHLQERKDHVIQILRLSRNRKLVYGLRSAHVLMHNQYTNIFSEETCMLDRLLTSVFTCTMFTKDVVYKMDQNIYQELHTRLMTRRAIASSSLNSFGYSDFKVPTWGINTMKGLTANDFEVYALQYRIRIEHFLHMLDYVHDWNNLRTHVYLDEKLLAAQCNPDRARVMIMEHYLHAVPPVPHSNPFKSKTSFQASSSDLSWEGVHYTATRDEEQHPSNSHAIKTQCQFCQCANSKVCKSQDFGRGRYESLPAVSYRAQFPEDLDFRNPSAHKSIYQGCAPSDLNSSQGGNNGNRLPSCRGPCNSQIPVYPGHSEYTSIGFDTALKVMDIPTCNKNPNLRDTCENKVIDIPAWNNSIGNPILPYSTNNEICTFQIASNMPCAPFSEKNKNPQLPRKVKRRIDRLLRGPLRIFHATSQVTSTNSNCQRTLMGMREGILWLLGLIIMRSEATRVQVEVNTLDHNVLQMVLDSSSYILHNSQKAPRKLSAWPKVPIKQKMNFMEQTRRTKRRLYSLHLIRHGGEVKTAITLATEGSHQIEVYVLSDTSQFTKPQKSCHHSKHRRVSGAV
ncbi:uncharacterized protein EV420DRAFT_1651555 [Desarmillaria tabescens]|uniref:Uncharacterized protein n=1 Tax=Armillaria tabescens TaxID=1929756 RepID=A0AA39JB93_ARMTA|nr:uncharacterized protein EV420DRAFT_1651555 [Desarmillaria tabescens]KAK0438174.1 hypothetical protein EV420DRAFT_1651555 [Desarmillaria tabescens]